MISKRELKVEISLDFSLLPLVIKKKKREENVERPIFEDLRRN